MQTETPEQRQYRRHAWRLSCEFSSDTGAQRGFITNVSARGFFIQTRAKLEAGTEVVVVITSESSPPISVTGTVARSRRPHHSMASIEQPGLGVQIASATEDYYQLVLDLEEK
ncbi:MAG: Tfp pilus assembly protein PilZ [Myxococcota bacterium]|jgi:Tfp pilus assembly protein PilZ